MNLNIKLLNQLLANIKGNYISKNKFATLKFNKGILKILYFLKVHGYIINYKVDLVNKKIKIYLKYQNSTPFILEIINFIKPGKISKKTHTNLLRLSKKDSYCIISTTKGLMFVYEAVEYGLGGILLFKLKI